MSRNKKSHLNKKQKTKKKTKKKKKAKEKIYIYMSNIHWTKPTR